MDGWMDGVKCPVKEFSSSSSSSFGNKAVTDPRGPECCGTPFARDQQVDGSTDDGTGDMQCFGVMFWMEGRQVLMIFSTVLSSLLAFFQTGSAASAPHRDAAG